MTTGAVATGAGVAGVTYVATQQPKPAYQNLYANQHYERKDSSVDEEPPKKKKKCCGPACWGLLACCLCLALILGLLLAFGVLSSLFKSLFSGGDHA